MKLKLQLKLKYDIGRNNFEEKILFYDSNKYIKNDPRKRDLIHELLSDIYYKEDIQGLWKGIFRREN